MQTKRSLPVLASTRELAHFAGVPIQRVRYARLTRSVPVTVRRGRTPLFDRAAQRAILSALASCAAKPTGHDAEKAVRARERIMQLDDPALIPVYLQRVPFDELRALTQLFAHLAQPRGAGRFLDWWTQDVRGFEGVRRARLGDLPPDPALGDIAEALDDPTCVTDLSDDEREQLFGTSPLEVRFPRLSLSGWRGADVTATLDVIDRARVHINDGEFQAIARLGQAARELVEHIWQRVKEEVVRRLTEDGSSKS